MRNHSPFMTSAVASGLPRYPFITLVPLIAISPTSPSGTSFQSPSIRRIAQPSTGVPIEPGLRTLSGWLNEATGEVSDRP